MKILTLKKASATIALATTLSASLCNPAQAARSTHQQAVLEGGTITSSAIAGGLIGGPLGAMAGSFIGILFADQTRKTNNANVAFNDSQQKNTQHTQKLALLQHEINTQELTITQLKQKTIDKLALQVLFNTGEDTLNTQDISRLEALAQHLQANDELIVNLSGHSDPRGAPGFNEQLAQNRAGAVKTLLLQLGIANSRIMTSSHGAQQAAAHIGQYEHYPRDRRVDIHVVNRRHLPAMMNTATDSDNAIANSQPLAQQPTMHIVQQTF